jgi:hypothetical protein
MTDAPHPDTAHRLHLVPVTKIYAILFPVLQSQRRAIVPFRISLTELESNLTQLIDKPLDRFIDISVFES